MPSDYKQTTYYTLQAPTEDPMQNDVYPEQFDSYEKAYDTMCDISIKSRELPFGIIVRYGIYRTTKTHNNGHDYEITQPVWNK